MLYLYSPFKDSVFLPNAQLPPGKKDARKVGLEQSQYFFLPHGLNATVYVQTIAAKREVEYTKAKIGCKKQPDFLVTHAAGYKHAAKVMLHKINLQIKPLRNAIAQHNGRPVGFHAFFARCTARSRHRQHQKANVLQKSFHQPMY